MNTPSGSRADEIVALAQDAISNGRVPVIRLREAWHFALAIERTLAKTGAIAPKDAFPAAIAGLRLACINCGEFNEEAKQAVLLGGQGGFVDQAKQVSFQGPKVAALAGGRCPGCDGEIALAAFHLLQPLPTPQSTKPWWKFW